MSIYVVNLGIEQGTDFQQTFDLTATNGQPLNLENYSGASQMRKYAGSKKSYTFTFSFTDRGSGQVKLAMTDSQTRDIKPGRYVYDVLLTDPNQEKFRVVEGQVLVRESATRS